MKKTIIILLSCFLFSLASESTNINFNPVFVYQDYVIKQVEKKEKIKIIIGNIFGIPLVLSTSIFVIVSYKKFNKMKI